MSEDDRKERIRQAQELLRANGVKLPFMTQPKTPIEPHRTRLTWWRKQLQPGAAPARSADELIAKLGFKVQS